MQISYESKLLLLVRKVGFLSSSRASFRVPVYARRHTTTLCATPSPCRGCYESLKRLMLSLARHSNKTAAVFTDATIHSFILYSSRPPRIFSFLRSGISMQDSLLPLATVHALNVYRMSVYGFPSARWLASNRATHVEHFPSGKPGSKSRIQS